MLKKLVLVTAVLSVGSSLAGCNTLHVDPYVPVTDPIPPIASYPASPIMHALACMRESRALRGARIAVAIHADGTGKYNHIADGATGNFLPQGTTAVYASQAVLFAGARPYNYYELNTERAMRAFANLDTQKRLADEQDKVLPHYVLSTSFTALDFIGGPTVDVRIGGVGPTITGRGAALEAVAELYEPGTRSIDRISSVKRYMAYREVGVGVANFVGGGVGTLVTGSVSYGDQQRIQEASRDVVALSVADVLSRFPRVPARCRAEVAGLLAGQGWGEPVPGAPPPPPEPTKVVLTSKG